MVKSKVKEDHIYSRSVPSPGQLVEVRRRQWVVSEVQGSSLEHTKSQHLVSLTSIDEDSNGEELQIIWQLEPGAKIIEKAGLPRITGWDSSDQMDAFLDAIRWGASTNADRSFLQAPFRSGITIEDYQLDPLVRAVDMARVNLLIADDVGLGKTIEAGLVIQELLLRHRARSVLIICPASLQLKWKSEMQDKFGLEFRVVDTDYVKQLRRERGIHTNPWTSFPRLITSMDWMKNGEGLRLIKDILPPQTTYPRKFDILVIDEAHNVAPSGASNYAVESQRTKLIRMISPHFNHRLFLSATPHNGYQESFTSLLELLDDQRFARTVMPEENKLQQVMVRRLKNDIVDEKGLPVFPVRQLEGLEIDYSTEEIEIHNLLQEFINHRNRHVNQTKYGVDFIHTLLKKRLFSSPMAFATTLSKYRNSLENGSVKKRENSSMRNRILHNAILRTKDDYSDDYQLEDALHEVIEIVSEDVDPVNNKELQILDKLSNWAETAKYRTDSKAEAILDWLRAHLKNGNQWNNKRVVLFTEYRATHAWLHQILASNGYGGDRLMFLHGSMLTEERERVKAAFQADPNISPVRILLATDAASEGIDLQNHCNYLIHVEIPWNPNVMEQRNGRIDRHGQKEKFVYIWHPVGKGFSQGGTNHKNNSKVVSDHEFLMRAALKVDRIREDLGSVGAVIALQIEEAMLGNRKTLDTNAAETKAAKSRKFIRAERQLNERISRLHDKLLEAKEDFHLSPGNIYNTVKIALELADKPNLVPVNLHGVPKGKVFEVPTLPGSWGRATEGLEHPHTGERRPITFDHDIAKGRDDIVLAHLNHKLVQMCLRLLREEVWKLDDIKKLNRVSVRTVPSKQLENPAVLIQSRLVITGGDHHRIHEELTLTGGLLKEKGFTRISKVSKVEFLLDSSIPIEPSISLFDFLKQRFESNEEAIISTVEARSQDRLKFLENNIERREKAEIEDITTILDDLEKIIEREINEQKTEQLQFEFWPDDQRNQLRRDVNALRARLSRIPEEKKLEIATVQDRYSNLIDRTFPVAVVFLVPESLLKGDDKK
ncbi:DISARM system SNF2-like helicase DrmD [Aneurinibacillus sp. Ricciae_BoGa-3]|uniref:DISARM system SNF2-like helicase DrmD n=1 Tax=Aneurinibacillus sp. Ricciae_BoGa-3 TaxID=3022697 RepID=UPI0023420C2E|nr:DISARM system SNF2-like helicase DrmD [Aneurinibacillus sp. Ricciae_BoGa-3]WCK55150.1 DISARM system SNF2-like helicase DrmD [Aneurinibacillus sp. Ricciae_BoGa-3]